MANANAATMAIVAEIFAAFPGRFRFTSGTRTAAQNAAAGGVSNSFHLTGQAADFVAINGRYPAGEKEAIGRILARHGYEVVFHNAGSGLHYHIEPAPGGVITLGPPVGNLAAVNGPAADGDKTPLYVLGLVLLALLL